MSQVSPDDFKDAVYDILVELGGASESARSSFRTHWPECREWRFMGHLGFGGKIWATRSWAESLSRRPIYVNYYPEDRTDERDQIQIWINERLDNLRIPI